MTTEDKVQLVEGQPCLIGKTPAMAMFKEHAGVWLFVSLVDDRWWLYDPGEGPVVVEYPECPAFSHECPDRGEWGFARGGRVLDVWNSAKAIGETGVGDD